MLERSAGAYRLSTTPPSGSFARLQPKEGSGITAIHSSCVPALLTQTYGGLVVHDMGLPQANEA